MCQIGQHECFAFEGRGRLSDLLCCQTAPAHLLYSDKTIGSVGIPRLINRAKSSLAHDANDAVALPEQGIVDELPGKGSAGRHAV